MKKNKVWLTSSVRIRLSDEERNKLDTIARNLQISRSALIRQYIHAGVSNKESAKVIRWDNDTIKTTQSRMQELEERKRLFNDELIAERNRQKYALKKEHVVLYLECFIGSLNEPSLRDKVFAYLIENVYIYSDKVVVNLYYSEDNRKIDLKEYNKYLDNLDNIKEIMNGAESFVSVQKKLDAMWESIIALDEDEQSF